MAPPNEQNNECFRCFVFIRFIVQLWAICCRWWPSKGGWVGTSWWESRKSAGNLDGEGEWITLPSLAITIMVPLSKSTYRPLVRVQLLIRPQQETGCCGRKLPNRLMLAPKGGQFFFVSLCRTRGHLTGSVELVVVLIRLWFGRLHF